MGLFDLTGRAALITGAGAGGGIGAAVAAALAQAGAAVLVTDIDSAALDVTDRASADAAAEQPAGLGGGTLHILVNALAPLAATPMTETIRTNEKFAANMMNRIPMKRWAEPSEIAGAFVFMASNAASYITGQVLPVDGGMVI